MSKTTSTVKPRTRLKSTKAFNRVAVSQFTVPRTSVHKVEADGVRVFYRAANDSEAPVVLLLHGFPTSSFMFRELIPRLAEDYRVIAPDLPGFGFTEVPTERRYVYSFDGLARTIEAFTQALKIDRYAIYVFDYGAPIPSSFLRELKRFEETCRTPGFNSSIQVISHSKHTSWKLPQRCEPSSPQMVFNSVVQKVRFQNEGFPQP